MNQPESLITTRVTKRKEEEQEKKRLQALYRYKILDTAPEEKFDHIVELSSEICNTPMALISFIDKDRQWTKAKIGFQGTEIPREDSFCTHCIENEEGEVLEIENAENDPRFQENPYVAGEPHLRFYAGAPMVDSDGHALGCVCVLDQEPRMLSKKEHFFLRTMAEQVVRELENRADNEELRRSQEEIEQSLTYAKRIQNALFQPTDSEKPQVPDHFKMLKPLSDVSGDFYWAKEHQGYFYIAAMDCTGHGIPGGFMSMLGISFLNDVLSEEGALEPGEILNRVRRRIVRELKGNDPLSGARDGMDAAILRIPLSGQNDPGGSVGSWQGAVGKEEDKEGAERANGSGSSDGEGSEHVEVEFAGAQNPLYVIRKGIGKQELREIADPEKQKLELGRVRPFKVNAHGIEVKGDRKPVGYDEFAEGGFKTVSLKLKKGDMLYIFSDGYADQFGGPKGKKFQYGNFKRLLTDIHQDSLKVQKERLDRSFETWKKASEQDQIDDVLVVGIRL